MPGRPPRERALGFADQEEFGLGVELAFDVAARIVPGSNEVAGVPQGNHCLLIRNLERTNLHGASGRCSNQPIATGRPVRENDDDRQEQLRNEVAEPYRGRLGKPTWLMETSLPMPARKTPSANRYTSVPCCRMVVVAQRLMKPVDR